MPAHSGNRRDYTNLQRLFAVHTPCEGQSEQKPLYSGYTNMQENHGELSPNDSVQSRHCQMVAPVWLITNKLKLGIPLADALW